MDTLAFETKIDGTCYRLPKYRITSSGLMATGDFTEFEFIRGSVDGSGGVQNRDGVLHETILQMIINDLEYKHALVPAEEGARTLGHLRSALDALNARTYRRQMRGLYGTYRK